MAFCRPAKDEAHIAKAVTMKQLDENLFVRKRLMGSDAEPRWKKYASFVIGNPTPLRLLNYELRVFLFGWIPGSLGIVLRKRFYKSFFKAVGKGLVIGRNVTIRHGDKITLGDNVFLDDYSLLDGRGSGEEGVSIGSNTILGRAAFVQSKVGSIKIGNNVNIGTYSIVTAQGGIIIDDWVQIAGACKISGGRFKLDLDMKEGVPFKRYSNGPIHIEEYSFLGGSSHVADGTTIGRCSVIGAGSIVMNNLPAGSVYMPKPGMVMGNTLE